MIQRIKSKARELREDPHIREVSYGTLLAFILRILGSGLAFAFNVAVARMLGVEGAGLYFLALSITTTCAVLSSVGLNNALLSFVAAHAAHKEWGKVKGVHAAGMRVATIASGILTLAGFICSPWVSDVIFHKPLLAEALRWMSLSILPFTLLNLHAQSLKGLKHIRRAMLVQSIGVPLVSLALIWPLARFAGLSGVAWTYLAATALVGLLAYWSWCRALDVHDAPPVHFSSRELRVICMPFFIISMTADTIFPFAPVLLLGMWSSSEEVGVFGAANRIAMLVSLLLVTANNVIAPKFSELYAQGDIEALGRTARRFGLIIALLASPIFLLLIFNGRWVMALFGSGFEQGALILSILAAGQMVNLMAGSSGYLLMMTGNERVFQRLIVWSAFLLLVLSVILVPLMGSIGAALAATCALICMNVASVWFVRKIIGIQMIPFARIGVR